uniref:Uncharacterized protein n=1 Tax=Amphimedon queenslandica TaxID=400682 RepID=A0A1X7V8Q3_AMPQE
MKWIGQAFGLTPETILLYTQDDWQLEVPDETRQFHLDGKLVYTVQKDVRPPGSNSTTSSTPDRPAPSGSLEFPNFLTSLLPYGTIGMPYQTHGPTTAKNKCLSLKSKALKLIKSESSETWSKSIELHYYHKGSLMKGTVHLKDIVFLTMIICLFHRIVALKVDY